MNCIRKDENGLNDKEVDIYELLNNDNNDERGWF